MSPYQQEAERRFREPKTVIGDGPLAILVTCNPNDRRVLLFATETERLNRMRYYDENVKGCGDGCCSKHHLKQLRLAGEQSEK